MRRKKITPIGPVKTLVINTYAKGRKAYILLETGDVFNGMNLRKVNSRIPFAEYNKHNHHCFILGDAVVHADSTPQNQFYTYLVKNFLGGDIGDLGGLRGMYLTTTWWYHEGWHFYFPGFGPDSKPIFTVA